MAAAGIPEISLGELFARMAPREKRVPLEGILETTYRCNLNCVHCYVNKAAGDAVERAQELSTERLLRLVDEIAAAGALNVLLTGGEVLVRPDFERVYRHCLQKGLLVTVFTNGTEVTERIADLFAAERPLAIEVSLYGMTKDTYERVTRVPGSFEKCLAGIRRLHDRDLPLKLKTMALTWNAHEVAAMRAFARRPGGALPPRLPLEPAGGLRLEPQRRAAARAQASRWPWNGRTEAAFARLAAHAQNVVGPRGTPEPDQPLYTCGAGLTGFTVDPYGRPAALPALAQDTSSTCARSRSPRAGTRSSPPCARGRGRAIRSAERCDLIGLCGSCPGAAELEHGDPEAQVAAFCEIAHERAFATLGDARHRGTPPPPRTRPRQDPGPQRGLTPHVELWPRGGRARPGHSFASRSTAARLIFRRRPRALEAPMRDRSPKVTVSPSGTAARRCPASPSRFFGPSPRARRDIALEVARKRRPLAGSRRAPVRLGRPLERPPPWPRRRLYVFREPLPGHLPLKALLIDAGLRRGISTCPRPARATSPATRSRFPFDEMLFQHRLTPRVASSCTPARSASHGGPPLLRRLGRGQDHPGRPLRSGRARGAQRRSGRSAPGQRPHACVSGTPWHGSGRFGIGRLRTPARGLLLEASHGERSAAPRIGGGRAPLRSHLPAPLGRSGGGPDARGLRSGSVRLPLFELRFRKDRHLRRWPQLSDGPRPRAPFGRPVDSPERPAASLATEAMASAVRREEKEVFAAYLAKHRLKRSEQREAILDAFLRSESHLSVDDLLQLVAEAPARHRPHHRLPHPEAAAGRRARAASSPCDGETRFEREYKRAAPRPLHLQVLRRRSSSSRAPRSSGIQDEIAAEHRLRDRGPPPPDLRPTAATACAPRGERRARRWPERAPGPR